MGDRRTDLYYIRRYICTAVYRTQCTVTLFFKDFEKLFHSQSTTYPAMSSQVMSIVSSENAESSLSVDLLLFLNSKCNVIYCTILSLVHYFIPSSAFLIADVKVLWSHLQN